MISENSTHKTQARAFSLFAFTSNLGIFLGPFLGTVPFPVLSLVLSCGSASKKFF